MQHILKIDIGSEEIIKYLKSETKLREVYQNILSQRVIDSVAQERNIVVTAEEIQAEADVQRREQRLEKAADTLAWLTQQLISPQEWEDGIHNRLLARKLAEDLFAQEVEKFFIQNRLQFEQVTLYQMIIGDHKLAQELYYQLEEDEISFYEAVHLYDIDENRRKRCGYEGKIYRWSIQPDIAAIVFSHPPHQLIGPIKSEQGHHLLIIDEFISAELTPQRYQEILNNMFQHWLTTEIDYLFNSL